MLRVAPERFLQPTVSRYAVRFHCSQSSLSGRQRSYSLTQRSKMGCGGSVQVAPVVGPINPVEDAQHSGKKKRRVSQLSLRYEVYYQDMTADGSSYDSENQLFTPFQNEIRAAFHSPKLDIKFVKLKTPELRVVLTSLNDTPTGDVVLVHEDAPLALESYSRQPTATLKTIRAIRRRVVPATWRPWLTPARMIDAFKRVVIALSSEMERPGSSEGTRSGNATTGEPFLEKLRRMTIIMDELYLLEFIVTPSPTALMREHEMKAGPGAGASQDIDSKVSTNPQANTPTITTSNIAKPATGAGSCSASATPNTNVQSLGTASGLHSLNSHRSTRSESGVKCELESKSSKRAREWQHQFARAVDDLHDAIEFYTREQHPLPAFEWSQDATSCISAGLATEKWLAEMPEELLELRTYFTLFIILSTSVFPLPSLYSFIYGENPVQDTYALPRIYAALTSGSNSNFPQNLLNSPLVKGRSCEVRVRQALAMSARINQNRRATLTLNGFHSVWRDIINHVNVGDWTPEVWKLFGVDNLGSSHDDISTFLMAGWSLYSAGVVEYLTRQYASKPSNLLEFSESSVLGTKLIRFHAFKQIKEFKNTVSDFINMDASISGAPNMNWYKSKLLRLDPAKQYVSKPVFRYFVVINCYCVAENIPIFIKHVLDMYESEHFMSSILPVLTTPPEQRIRNLFIKLLGPDAPEQPGSADAETKTDAWLEQVTLPCSAISPQVLQVQNPPEKGGFTLAEFHNAMRLKGVLSDPNVARGVERYWYQIYHKFQC